MTTAYNFLNTAKYYCTLSIMDYNRPKPFDPGKFNLRKVIRLPLPQELRDDTAVAYNNVDLKLVGDIANKSLGTGLASEGLRQAFGVNAVVKATADGARAAGAATGGVMGGLVGNIGGAIGDAIDPEAVSSAFQQGLGVAPNPNPSVAFQGPSLRELSYTWTFMPTNETDSQRIREIINYLKGAALPRADVSLNSAAILEYPALCQINFFPWDNGGGGSYGWSDNSIIKMKRCFMSSVNANYTAGAAPSFFAGKNNEPTIIQLSINLKEIEYFMAHDYEKGATSKGLTGGFDDLFAGIFNADYNATPPDNGAQDPAANPTDGATT